MRICGIDLQKPELLLARAAALSTQIPMMYLLVLICSGVLVWTHWTTAPVYLTVYFPLALTVLCAFRLVRWWHARGTPLSAEQAVRMLTQTMAMAAVLGVMFAWWALSMAPYGGPFEQAHVMFYLGFTPIACLFCLMHLRVAALILAIVVLIPTLVYFYFSGNHVLFLIAINMLLVELVMATLLVRNSMDFDRLIASRRESVNREQAARELSEINARLANIDSLTGLANRRHFLHLLQERLGEQRPSVPPTIVGIIDLDGFKAINDVFGHAIGDQVLVQAGARLNQLGEVGTVVARLGGDEFGIILAPGTRDDQLDGLATILVSSLQQPFRFPGAVARISGSVGFAATRAGDTAEEALARADYAAYEAKTTARGNMVRFSAIHAERIAADHRLEAALMNADFASELTALFQPVVDGRTGERLGYEALARWSSPTLGDVPPSKFIPMAERLGLVPVITRAMVAKAIVLVDQLPKPIRVAVNLSARDLASTEAMRALSHMLSSTGTKPCRLDFEVTETAVMRDVTEASQGLLMLLAHGARISLDDFGTGHSSLSRVQTLPLDRIKIDSSFVAGIESDRASQAIVKTILSLCQNLGLSCVVEGVETWEQVQTLSGLGATIFQGYYFGRPQAADDVLAYHRADAAGQLSA
ncbi:putative bifunctional diguanylate cyclase/phosphodiesterase [Devosia sp.]|uniref:putative bifunctional diguanylate cyclase/phosphodiesterase n=1 Tax=Devosia sp. TaxID=1871048 RepID=UPI003BAB3798